MSEQTTDKYGNCRSMENRIIEQKERANGYGAEGAKRKEVKLEEQ